MKKSNALRVQDNPPVLLVAENRLGLIARRAVLEELGCRVTTAANLAEGVELLGANSFHLVVADLKSSHPNILKGVAFIEEVRKASRAVPVVLLCAFAEQLGFDPKSTGADVVIEKGSNEVALLGRAVTRLLSRRKPPQRQKAAAKSSAKSS